MPENADSAQEESRPAPLNTRQWAGKQINKFQADAVKMLKIAHSRCESIRSTAQDFHKDNVKELARNIKKKIKEAQEMLGRLPPELGKAFLRPQVVSLTDPRQGTLELREADSDAPTQG